MPPPNPFSPETLTRLIAETLPAAGTARVAIIGGVDTTGAQVVAGFTSQNGAWQLTGAYRHDWATGDDQVFAKVMFKW